MTRVVISNQVAKVDRNARVVIAAGNELVATPAGSIAALATSGGVPAPVMTAPAASPDKALLYVDSVDGDLKVIFPNGVVKTIATN